MTLDLPKPVAAYFTADKENSNAVAACFTENAIVKDEGHTYTGRAAIKQWKADASAQFQYTVEPFDCGQIDDRTIVTSNVVGNFPGSPVVLRFVFRLEGDRIALLEVVP